MAYNYGSRLLAAINAAAPITSLHTMHPEAQVAAKLLNQSMHGGMGKPEWLLLGFRKGPGEVQVLGSQKILHVDTQVSQQSPSIFSTDWNGGYGSLRYHFRMDLSGLSVVQGMNWTQAMDGFPAPGEDGW